MFRSIRTLNGFLYIRTNMPVHGLEQSLSSEGQTIPRIADRTATL
jgi:hypothetical protein